MSRGPEPLAAEADRTMKHTQPDVFLTRDILCFVRDQRPTAEEVMAHIGDTGFHLLRKHAAILIEGGRVRLNRRHLSPDGRRFVWGRRMIHLDTGVVELVRWGAGGPTVYADEP